MKPNPITHDAAREEIKRLEDAYGRRFLKKSLHRDALRWRELTAPNARERISMGQINTAHTTPQL